MRILKTVRLTVIVIGFILLASPDGALASNSNENDSSPTQSSEVEHLSSVTLSHGGGTTMSSSSLVYWSCLLKADDPHDSHHEDGTINTEGWTRCDVIMNSLTVATTLQKETCLLSICWWSNFAPTGTKTRTFAKYVRSNSAASCQNGNYRGRTRHTVVWPDGASEVAFLISWTVTITC